MIKKLFLLLVVVAIAAGSAFWYLQNKGVTLHFSETQLLEKLAQRLPLSKEYLLIFEVVIDNPTVTLVDGDARVYASLEVVINLDIGFDERSYEGKLKASSGVRYQAVEGEVFLSDPKIESFQMQGLPDKYVKKRQTR